MKQDDKLKKDLNLSATVMVVLVAVNIVEFWFATVIKSQLVLFWSMVLLALVDTALIMGYYMHFWRLFGPDEEGDH
jgi:hypothetical protein